MKIKTELLKAIVAKSVQGASNNKMIPITSLVGIEYKQGFLSLITTDGSNQLIVKASIDKNEDEFYSIVNADTFSKLISKTTSEFVEFENKENYLLLTGNGSYKLEIAINEDGEMVKFDIAQPEGEPISINLNNLQETIKSSKASVANTMEIPFLTGYYLSDNCITTNRQMVCKLNNNLLSQSILISSQMAELLLLIENSEDIKLYKNGNKLIFVAGDYIVSGNELEGKDTYPVKSINDLDKMSFDKNIQVSKHDLLDVLDRMSLFVTDYDRNGVDLAFTKEALLVKSQKSDAQELIDAKGSSEEEFDCLVDIEMLKSQIEVISTDLVDIYYGQDKMIKIIDGNATFIISLLSKEN